jgi:hypothetical protein
LLDRAALSPAKVRQVLFCSENTSYSPFRRHDCQFATDSIARSDAFLFDTQLGILKGDGEINLATEKIDFLLSPKPKDNSLFSLATKLRVTGSVLDPRVRPDMTSVAKKGAKALSSLVLGPAGLLLPFMSSGARNQHPCDIQALRHRVHSIYD